MNKKTSTYDPATAPAETVSGATEAEAEPEALLGIPGWPFRRTRIVSGSYEWQGRKRGQHAYEAAAALEPGWQGEAAGDGGTIARGPRPLVPERVSHETFNLDIDGYYPQMTASGTLQGGLAARAHWIAALAPRGTNRWTGYIWYKHGDTGLLPHTNVMIHLNRGWFRAQRTVAVTFTGGGAPPRTRVYRYRSASFHPVELEYDTVEGAERVTSVNTCAHPNRPAGIPCENLSIEDVYRRAGFDVRHSADRDVIPLAETGVNGTWSNMEMHDAMQDYWSRFANAPQWATWALFASLHDQGSTLGGIMFDSIGPNHRQGTAVFSDSFISQPPATDPNPAAWVRRMRFWTICHELGHSFNLAHSWQKTHPAGVPWINLADEPEARSFMNYAYNVVGGQTAFFADFEYRFSNMELLFLRHAPGQFVQMGNADWFDNHGFRQADVAAEPTFSLEVRANRQVPAGGRTVRFEFLEPAMLELKLTNISGEAKIVDGAALSPENLTVIIKKRGKAARQWAPYARYVTAPTATVLGADQSLYAPLAAFAGTNGWDMAEPGSYMVQVACRMEDKDIISSPLYLQVTPPGGADEEILAQDFLTDGVGRVLAFRGSRSDELAPARAVLREAAARMAGRRAALHAHMALAMPMMYKYKSLAFDEETGARQPIAIAEPIMDEAMGIITGPLAEDADAAAESLGHITYKACMDRYCTGMLNQERVTEADRAQKAMKNTLKARQVPERVFEASPSPEPAMKHA